MANKLASETSRYLRQHANNPVDWYPWGAEALARARSEDKPILLSIGYSACHWCHVMERESFENPVTAALMNERFINIKVDREERPDLDHLYQNVAQLMTRSGGWPLTVFLTPELKPYFGGTYFPPLDQKERPGFPRVLVALSDAYRTDRATVAENARRLAEAIHQIETSSASELAKPTRESLRKICDAINQAVDWRNGGFGGAPKFPNVLPLSYLWRFGAATGFGMAQEAVVTSLAKMARGGIYDQLGGGFHRYTVDERWRVPHFEKMLYDNALLLRLYAEVLLTGDLQPDDRTLFAAVLADTTRYVLREMRMPAGGFCSSQDADTEGAEGKFFTWTPRELRAALTDIEARAFELRYGVTEDGCFEDTGKSVLYLDKSIADVAHALGVSAPEASKLLDMAKSKLFIERERRPRPGRDEKIIASWNGLMISGLAWSSVALRATDAALAAEALAAAVTAFEFVCTKMSAGEDRLHSVFSGEHARMNAYLDDYAFMAMSALDLARFSEDQSSIERLLGKARAWVDRTRTHFRGESRAGFCFTSDDHEPLFERPRSIFDQAIPSGNAVLIECLVALGEIFPDSHYDEEAEAYLGRILAIALQAPMGMGETACAGLLYLQGPVLVSGAGASRASVHPNVFQTPAADPSSGIAICHRRVCDLPLTDADAARALALSKTIIRS